ncbi:hypothetical protein M569_17589 [Genlisea aurea]|uniref:Chromo domain-containing protein n=1 Tax=Genlisea aurea TaxID=192259 RepID=S8BYH5_9LAMI|nr:hypothetical protein M569_17589 [Genlisea aurea]
MGVRVEQEVHIDQLKPCRTEVSTATLYPMVYRRGDPLAQLPETRVKRVIDLRMGEEGPEIMVEWEGQEDPEGTWVPVASLGPVVEQGSLLFHPSWTWRGLCQHGQHGWEVMLPSLFSGGSGKDKKRGRWEPSPEPKRLNKPTRCHAREAKVARLKRPSNSHQGVPVGMVGGAEGMPGAKGERAVLGKGGKVNQRNIKEVGRGRNIGRVTDTKANRTAFNLLWALQRSG